MKRLFWALWPPEHVRAQLDEIAGNHVKHGRRIPAERLHLTLRFLGHVSSEQAAALVQTKEINSTPGFTLRLQKSGYFTKSKIFWLGPTQTPPALQQLVELINHYSEAAGLDRVPKNFRPHVTLARNVEPLDHFELPQVIQWPVSQFSLVESRQGVSGPEYTNLAHWPLAGM